MTKLFMLTVYLALATITLFVGLIAERYLRDPLIIYVIGVMVGGLIVPPMQAILKAMWKKPC